MWTTTKFPRNIIRDDGDISSGTFYTPFCLTDGFVMDVG